MGYKGLMRTDESVSQFVSRLRVDIQLISYKRYWSVHSLNGDYLSIPEGTVSGGYLFHEIPGISFHLI